MDIKEYIASGVIEAYVLDTLSSKERSEVEVYLVQYPELQEELSTIEENLEALAFSTGIMPPSSLKENIFSNLESEEPVSILDEPIVDPKVISINKPTTVWNYVAAASIAAAIVTSFLAYNYHNKWQKAEEAYGQLQAANQQMADQYNQVNNRLDQLVADIDIISSADFTKVNMGAVNEGQDFAASVYWNAKTEEAYLNIENLQTLSESKQYQLWAIVDGQPVDMGVFDFDQEGLLKMKNVAKAAMFAVTIEPKGGSENPTLEAMQVAGQIG